MKKAFLKLSIFTVLFTLLLVPAVVSAVNAPGNPGTVELNLPMSDNPQTAIVDAIITILNTVLGLLGLIAVIIIIVGGFKYMASGGDADKAAKARKLLTAGLIGLIIIVFAYLIAGWVVSTLYGVA